jgi:hypothetical protein
LIGWCQLAVKADYVVPGGEACGHFSAVGIGAELVAAGSEVR